MSFEARCQEFKLTWSLAGATIIVTYTSKDATEAVKPISEKYGVPIHVYRCPGEESKVVDEVVEKASKEVGEIDVVIVNAGQSFPHPTIHSRADQEHD